MSRPHFLTPQLRKMPGVEQDPRSPSCGHPAELRVKMTREFGGPEDEGPSGEGLPAVLSPLPCTKPHGLQLFYDPGGEVPSEGGSK